LKAKLYNLEQSKKLNSLKTEVDGLIDSRTKTKISNNRVTNDIDDVNKDKLEIEYNFINKQVLDLRAEVYINNSARSFEQASREASKRRGRTYKIHSLIKGLH
jgi:hypothetical protein